MALIQRRPGSQALHQTQRLASKSPLAAQVVRVCDGDTIVVAVDVPGQLLPVIEYVRLAGVDAPELRGPERGRAIASRDALAALIELDRVTVTPTRIWRDPYHRIVARVTLGTIDVGTWLIDSGYAVPRSRHKSHIKRMSHSDIDRVAPRSPESRHPH